MIISKSDATFAAMFPVYENSDLGYTGFNFYESGNIRDTLYTTLY